MVKKFLILVCFLCFSQTLQASPQAALTSEHYQPGEGWDSWSLEVGYHVLDFDLEEEILGQDLDDVDSEYLRVKVGWMWGLKADTMLLGHISHSQLGERSRIYADDIELDDMQEDFQGLESIGFGVQKRFTQFTSEGIDQSVQLKIRSGVISSKDQNASLGGTDLSAHYLYSFYHNWGEVYGSVDGHYYGTKKLRRTDGEIQETKRFSEFGFTIGVKRIWSHWYVAASTGFGLMTDYIISSPSYNRAADNGFSYQGEISLGWYSEMAKIEIFAFRRSDVFNKSRLDIEGEIDYELESEHTGLRFLWPF